MSKVYDELRKAIEHSNRTRYWLWQKTGVDQALLTRFMAGKSGLSIKSVEKLIDVLGLEIVIKKKLKQKKVKNGKRN